MNLNLERRKFNEGARFPAKHWIADSSHPRIQSHVELHDLAKLYGVEVRTLHQAVKRNKGRFPTDFMFQLTWEETNSRSQTVILNQGENIKYRPYAFTEQGVAMLSSVLRSISFAVIPAKAGIQSV